jgi:hypothetical protein
MHKDNVNITIEDSLAFQQHRASIQNKPVHYLDNSCNHLNLHRPFVMKLIKEEWITRE